MSVLALLYLSISPTEAQTTLPLTYPAQVLSGGEQMGCPSDGQREATRNTISQNINDMLPRIVDAIRDCRLQEGKCPNNPAASCNAIYQQDITAPSGDYWVTASDGSAVLVFCVNSGQWGSNETGWTRIAYLDMTDQMYSCPDGWRYITSPNRTCGRALTTGGCQSVTYSSLGKSYSQVCGRVYGYQYAETDAFWAYVTNQSLTIDDPYVDGVVITHGNPRNHVWTFASGRSEYNSGNAHCPCNNGNSEVPTPSWVGQSFFCESGSSNYMFSPTFYSSDLLWDGDRCDTSVTTCCSFNNPPWFCQDLPEATTDDIEVRVCGTEGNSQEDSPIELIELYVL